MTVLGYLLAIVVGLSLGMLGGGGSTLTVPIFVYVLGLPAKSAIAMSLPVVGTTSLVGALSHWRAGNVDVRVAVLFGLVAMAGSYTGARFAELLSGTLQLLLLAVVMIVSAVSMLRRTVPTEHASASPALLALVGVGVGLLTGIVGIGGGFLIVPALVVLGRVPIRQAIGTSLLVIAMNTVSGSLGYATHVSFDWGIVILFTALALTGVLVGTRVASRVPAASLKRAFGIFLILVGALILVQNRHALANPGADSPPPAPVPVKS